MSERGSERASTYIRERAKDQARKQVRLECRNKYHKGAATLTESSTVPNSSRHADPP